MTARRAPPSLTRHVILAVSAALMLVWATLLLVQLGEVRLAENHNPAVTEFAATLAEVFAHVDDSARVRDIGDAYAQLAQAQHRRGRSPVLLAFEVRDAGTGDVVYASQPELALGSVQPGYSTRTIGQTVFFVLVVDGPRWRIVVAQSRIPGGWVLKEVAWDLTKYVLIAVPLVFLPILISVWWGLRPLRALSAELRGRSPEDVRPLAVPRRYAELATVTDAFDDLTRRLGLWLGRERAFVHDAAHELRTPMTAVALHAHAAAQAELPEERRERLADLDRALDRASRLVDQLLRLARAEGAPRPRHNLNVSECIRDALVRLEPAATQRGVELAFEGPEALFEVVDETSLESIIANLVDNAIRHGVPGGHVQVALDVRADTWRLVVEDDGPGIAAGDRPHVFDRFFRGRATRATGSGLGLAIVRAAVEQMGGTVALADTAAGQGCCFVVTVPRVAPATLP